LLFKVLLAIIFLLLVVLAATDNSLIHKVITTSLKDTDELAVHGAIGIFIMSGHISALI